ncbi:hypothetical protein TcCL_ESM09250 [Trypanosoma cruzi]|nr:hypothetical protein TcCL_ESM09250 [Trypanosoma cruzi]
MSNLRVCYLPLSAVAFFGLSCGAQLLCKYRRCQTYKHMHTRHNADAVEWCEVLERMHARCGWSRRALWGLVCWCLWLYLATLISTVLERPVCSWAAEESNGGNGDFHAVRSQ